MPMTVQCPECQTEFPVDPAKIPEGGVRAQCSVCPGIFPVFSPQEEAAPEPDFASGTPDLETEGFETEAFETDAFETDSFATETVSPEVVEPEAFETETVETEAIETETVEVEAFETEPVETEAFEIDAFETGAPETPDAQPEVAEEAPASTEAADGDFDQYFERTFAGDDLPSVGSSDDVALPSGDGIGTLEQSLEEARKGFAAEAEAPAVAEEASAIAEEAPPAVVEDDVAEAATPAPETTGGSPIQFGKRDPHEKAKRLARVLVSDMIVYHRDKHTQALAAGTLGEEFQDEVEKSMEEYVDQVGQEMADSTNYFREALNEILAKGRQVF